MNKIPGIILVSMLFLIIPILGVEGAQHCEPDPNNPSTEYCLLAPLPLTNPGGPVDAKTSTSTYLPGLFKLMIALATALAVVRLIYAGIKYMSTDAFGGKEDAKGIIEETLWGLLLVMSSWLIINTINPKLLDFDLKIEKIDIQPAQIQTTQGSLGQPSNLTSGAIQAQLTQGGVRYVGTIILDGLQQSVIDEVIRLKRQCGCTVVVTSATGGRHEDGQFDHGSGHKVDLRSQREGETLTNFILNSYEKSSPRSNGDLVFRGPTGAIYVYETHRPPNAGPDWAPHWDITVR